MSLEHRPASTREVDSLWLPPETVVFEPFYDQANHENDPAFAEDLRFNSQIAERVRDMGGRALVVGGYVRDTVISQVTGEPQASKDIDTEVYGVEIEALMATLKDFGAVKEVGESFMAIKVKNAASGNWLDFAIPRTDSKSGTGHKGFSVSGNPHMSIREAARRRDLTINALLVDPLTGELIDEYGGVQDIRDGVLRATDLDTFGDDPLRVLRVVQFAARFNFAVDPATAELCKTLDLTELSKERVGEEWIKLMTQAKRPSIGLELSRELGVLDQLHPQLAVLDQINQEREWHPEGNVWAHTKLVVDAAATIVRQEQLTKDEAMVVLFGALCHDLGKATTTHWTLKDSKWRLTARGHEITGLEPTREFLESLDIHRLTDGMQHDLPKAVLAIVREHMFCRRYQVVTDKTIQRLAERLQPANIRLWDLVARADTNGRGREFTMQTPSFEIYQRSEELAVAEQPAPHIVQGRDLISQLGLEPSPAFGIILANLYDAQLDGAFTTIEEGVAYYRQHETEIQQPLAE